MHLGVLLALTLSMAIVNQLGINYGPQEAVSQGKLTAGRPIWPSQKGPYIAIRSAHFSVVNGFRLANVPKTRETLCLRVPLYWSISVPLRKPAKYQHFAADPGTFTDGGWL